MLAALKLAARRAVSRRGYELYRRPPLSHLIESLQPHGYWLVGVYEQLGWHHLHAADFCNAIFAPASRR